MTEYTMPLDSDEAWAQLRSKSFGRLAVTLDGQIVALEANIELPEDAATAIDSPAIPVGLRVQLEEVAQKACERSA